MKIFIRITQYPSRNNQRKKMLKKRGEKQATVTSLSQYLHKARARARAHIYIYIFTHQRVHVLTLATANIYTFTNIYMSSHAFAAKEKKKGLL